MYACVDAYNRDVILASQETCLALSNYITQEFSWKSGAKAPEFLENSQVNVSCILIVSHTQMIVQMLSVQLPTLKELTN